MENLYDKGKLIVLMATAPFALGQASTFYTDQLGSLENRAYQQSIYGELKAQKYCEDAPSPKNLTDYEFEKMISHNQSSNSVNDLRNREYESNRIKTATLCLGLTSYSNKMHKLAVEEINDKPTFMRKFSVHAANILIPVGLTMMLASIVGRYYG